ncbi:hypothetical protein [Asinibacterium sp. OR53]|uniref:hypothetical protein n=1 Tax=Asinibacterium sp. OR53 TaxID=925409 RepID=UPI0004B93327|nr:hypothetical protein [Asinibacterium sp. OR53]
MTKDNEQNRRNDFGRRKFLRNGLILGGVVSVAGNIPNSVAAKKSSSLNALSGELLYNGIRLPEQWPPHYMHPDAYDPMPVPYLALPPAVIPVDVGRQLFIDDFLIEHTNLQRQFHQPVDHPGNPLLKPETAIEMNQGFCPVAAPFSDGVFYDPEDQLFKLWYMAGWFDGTALAVSKDGIHWDRPKLDIVPGTNLVLAPRDDFRRDGVSIWLDHDSKDPGERFKMYLYARQGKIGQKLRPVGGFLLNSPDGIHWKWGGKIPGASDNNTFFYNPFRKKWVFTIRKESRPVAPWSATKKNGGGRARSYWEGDTLQAALNNWEGSVFWFGADKYDCIPANYSIGEDPQIYKLDAVGYESVLLGLIQPHYGPANEICGRGGFPKLTELQLAFSRDGFHWDRTNRETFIGADFHNKESWKRAYVHSIGGTCLIVGDKLHFYYTAFRGNEQNRNTLEYWSGMYANASMGLAILRRDGFASMETNDQGTLLTRPVQFSGQYLFVNADARTGSMRVELCEPNGNAIEGFTHEECVPVSIDSTSKMVQWKHQPNLSSLSGRHVRIRFYVNRSKLYAFWISPSENGSSGGATAAGGPGLTGTWNI